MQTRNIVLLYKGILDRTSFCFDVDLNSLLYFEIRNEFHLLVAFPEAFFFLRVAQRFLVEFHWFSTLFEAFFVLKVAQWFLVKFHCFSTLFEAFFFF